MNTRLETAARQLHALKRTIAQDENTIKNRPADKDRLRHAIDAKQRAINRLNRRWGTNRLENEEARIYGQETVS